MLVPHPGGGPLGQGLPGPWHPPRLPAGLGFALGFAASVVATILAWLRGWTCNGTGTHVKPVRAGRSW
jgi:hypothetical protein